MRPAYRMALRRIKRQERRLPLSAKLAFLRDDELTMLRAGIRITILRLPAHRMDQMLRRERLKWIWHIIRKG